MDHRGSPGWITEGDHEWITKGIFGGSQSGSNVDHWGILGGSLRGSWVNHRAGPGWRSEVFSWVDHRGVVGGLQRGPG